MVKLRSTKTRNKLNVGACDEKSNIVFSNLAIDSRHQCWWISSNDCFVLQTYLLPWKNFDTMQPGKRTEREVGYHCLL
jgi:hypothetical protein